jgi:CRP/FNR family transcriptional regulator, cyclic AMP receptor protein
MNTTQSLPEKSLLYRAIADHRFLKGISDQHLETLANAAMFKEFAPGEWIFREDDMANRFYLILEGTVTLEAKEREAEAIAIEQIGAGEALGWSWLFPPYCWHLDARAIEPTKAIFFYGTRLRDEVEKDHSLGYELMKRMADVVIHRLQATRKQLVQSTAAARR